MDDVRAAAARWDAAFNGGDAAALTGFYAADARLVPPGSAPIEGAEAIGKLLGDLIASGFRDHRVSVDKVVEKGPVMIATGTWQLLVPAHGDTPAQRNGGNWVNVLERTAGGWRIVLHTWN